MPCTYELTGNDVICQPVLDALGLRGGHASGSAESTPGVQLGFTYMPSAGHLPDRRSSGRMGLPRGSGSLLEP